MARTLSEEDQRALQQFVISDEDALEGAVRHFKLRGQLKHDFLSAFTALIDREFEQGRFRILLGFHKVESILSSHLGILWQRCQISRQNGGDIKVCELSDTLHEAFTRVGFHRLISIQDDAQSALNLFQKEISAQE